MSYEEGGCRMRRGGGVSYEEEGGGDRGSGGMEGVR